MATSLSVGHDFRKPSATSARRKSRSLTRFIKKYLNPYSYYSGQISSHNYERSDLPPRVKELMLLVKYWYRAFVRNESNADSIVNITISAWENAHRQKTFNIAIAFKAVMEKIEDNGGPYKNYSSDWSRVQTVARETLRMPICTNVPITSKWQGVPRNVTSGVAYTTPKARTRKKKNKSNNLTSVTTNVDFRKLPSSKLDTFIADHLQPDEDFHSLVSSALDALCRYLQHKMQPSVRRLIKSGSMGKGTALKNSSDLDCILIMNEIPDVEVLMDKLDTILTQIKSHLQTQPLQGNGWTVRIEKVNEYMVQFEMTNTSYQTVKVDLLPTFEANVLNGQSRNNLYQKMASYDAHTRSFCSAALAELQREFVIERPAKLKSLIRLVKHWCKTYLPELSYLRMPSSYLIELVTIHCWEQVGSHDRFNTAGLFKNVMTALCEHWQLNITWNRYYTLKQPTSSPSILDPANPYNDLYNDVDGWADVARVARETLGMPLMTSQC